MYFPTNLINFATLHLKGWTNRGKLWGLIYLAHSAYYIQIEIKASILILGSFLDFTFSLKSCSKYRAKPVSRRRGACIRLWSSATFSRHHLLPSMSEKKSETKNVSLTLSILRAWILCPVSLHLVKYFSSESLRLKKIIFPISYSSSLPSRIYVPKMYRFCDGF